MDEESIKPLLGTGAFSSKEEYEKRKEICRNCEFAILRKMLCGRCFCPIVSKAIIAKPSCPMNKWTDVDK